MPDILAFDRDALAGAAERIFFSFPGIRAMIAGTGDASCPESDRGGGNATDCKPGRRPDGRRIFRCTATDEMFAIRDRRFADLAAKAAFAPIPLSSFQNRCFDLDGRMICCEGFSAVRPHTAMGIYFCMATVGNDHAGGANDAGGANGGMRMQSHVGKGEAYGGDCDNDCAAPVAFGYESLIADMWANAYLESLKRLLAESLLAHCVRETGAALRTPCISHMFMPGLQGLDMGANAIICDITRAGRIGLRVLESGMMRPEKSVSAIYFIADGNKTCETDLCGGSASGAHGEPVPDSRGELPFDPCAHCAGGTVGCEFCAVRRGIITESGIWDASGGFAGRKGRREK